jgi:hypothetical protein
MRHLTTSFAAALLFSAVAPLASEAASYSRSCQSMNQWQICLRSSGPNSAISMSCRTVDGHSVCIGTGGLRCEATGGRPVCRGGRAGVEVEILPMTSRRTTLPPVTELDFDDDE